MPGAAMCWIRSLAHKGPRYLLLHVNTVCNAKCRMCFTWDRMMDRWDAHGIALEDLKKVARSLGDLPQLTVSGGEPLLRKDLPDVLAAFYELANTRFFTVPTNALRPDRVARLIDDFTVRCPDAYLNFCLPFHGDEATSEMILDVPGAAEKFRQTYDVLRERRANHPNISVLLNFVMSRFNWQTWPLAIERARRDYPETPLGIALCRGKTHWEDAGDVPIEAYEEAQRTLAGAARPWSGFNPYTMMWDTITDRIGTIVSEVVRGERRDLACGAGRQLLVIYDDGSVYPCEMLEVVGMPSAREGEGAAPAETALGRLQDYDFDVRRLLESAGARATVGWIRDHECACTWESAIYGKIVHSPSELLQLGSRAVRRLVTATSSAAPAPAAGDTGGSA